MAVHLLGAHVHVEDVVKGELVRLGVAREVDLYLGLVHAQRAARGDLHAVELLGAHLPAVQRPLAHDDSNARPRVVKYAAADAP